MKQTTRPLPIALLAWSIMTALAVGQESYSVVDFGARGDGKTHCTKAVQGAVDRCSQDGGGTVTFPAGKWLMGTVYLANNITIELENGATILGTTDKQRYGPPRQLMGAEGEQYSTWALFAGKGLHSVAIRGRGTIDGQGHHYKYREGSRPKNLYFEECRDVLIEGVRLRNAGSWMQHFRDCEHVTIRDIAVFNHVTYNNDGLNIDSCRDVTITGCMIDSDDDAIVLKSLSALPTENVTISDCVISSHCNAVKMGTESGGGFRNIAVTNCTIQSPRYSEKIYGRQRGLAGVALEIVDGGCLDGIALSNLTIRGVTVPIFMRLGNRARTYEPNQPKPGIGTFRNVTVNNIVAVDCSSVGCSITGLPGHRIENVTLSDISLGFDGGGRREEAERAIPEKAGSYPESTMFGTLPAFGFYCRHTTGLRLRNLHLHTTTPDYRHGLVLDDVTDSMIDGLTVPFVPGAAPLLRLTNTQRITLRNSHAPRKAIVLALQGSRTEAVRLHGNDFSQVERICDQGDEVPDSALVMWANLLGKVAGLGPGTADADRSYLDLVRDYADALIERGVDTYGNTDSPMILSMLDRTRMQPFSTMPEGPHGVRYSDRVTPYGCNINLDQNLYRVLYLLSEITGDARYSRAADAALACFLEVAPSPVTKLFAWGEHLCWDVKADKANSNDGYLTHEPKRPTVLFDRFYELNPRATIGYCEGLWEHQIHDHQTGNFSRHAQYHKHETSINHDFPKEGGYFIADWSRAYQKTGDPRFMKYIEVLTERYLRKMESNERNLIAFDSVRGFADLSASISLAVDCHASAERIQPGTIRDRLLALACGIDAGIQSLPHRVEDEGFVQYMRLEDFSLYPHKENGGYSYTWNMKYGRKTTAMLGVLFYSRYRQLEDGPVRDWYRRMVLAAADKYLTSDPNADDRPWPVELGIVTSLQLAAYELTARQAYYERARHFADKGVHLYWSSASPLPKADPGCDHYENITRADTLAYTLLQIYAIDNSFAFKIPISDIDR